MMKFNTIALASSDIQRTYDFFVRIGFSPARLLEVKGKEKSWQLLYLGENKEICYYPAKASSDIFSGLTFSQKQSSAMVCFNCDKPEEVDALHDKLRKIDKKSPPPLLTDWGRYAVYFRDSDGHCYEYSAPQKEKN